MKERKYRVYHKDSNSMEYSFDLIRVSQYLNKFTDKYIKDNIIILDWIGLFDKKGNGIYDGDILLMNDGQYKSSVIWCKDLLCWKAEHPNGDIESITAFVEEHEVVGNIYEHPNLIKGA